MKNTLIVLAVFLAVGVGLYASPAQAGDDPVTQISLSSDAGLNYECSGLLRAKVHYAVQPTVNAYVTVSQTGDGGVGVPTAAASPYIEANKLYDAWTTYDRRYICCKPAAAGAASSCKIFQYREGAE